MRKLKKINVLDKKIKKLQDYIHNNRYRHPELADCELRAELDGKIAKPLQTSIVDPLNASNQAVSGSQAVTNPTTYLIHNPSRPSLRKGRRKIAFTLAEVLITLGIIGVVAALTLPSVVAHYKEKVLVTQVQKAYSEMQNALKLYSAQNNCSDITCISDTNQTSAELADKLFAQFQGAKRCPGTWDMTRKICKTVQIKNKTPYYQNGVTAGGDGFSPVFVSANGVAYKVSQYNKCPSEYEVILRDDAGFPVLDEDGKPKTYKSLSVNCALIYFDANGVNKGPNQFGADIYRFNLTYDGKFVSYGDMINPALTKGKLEYTPHKLGQPKE